MIFEERIYRIHSGMMSTYLKLVAEEGLPIQQSTLGDLIGYFITEIGQLNHVVHIWRYASLDDRAERRKLLSTNVDWQKFVPKLYPCIENMENRILTATSFSPLQ